jgi:hypothetical protein
MKHSTRWIGVVLAAAATATLAHATVDDALSFAYEAASPYVKEGFSVREDAWGGDLGVKDQKAVTAQLFRGNEYWFLTGTDVSGAMVTVSVYDSTGKLAQSEAWQRGRFSGARVVPQRTGSFYAIITVHNSPRERTPWALVYAYR